MNSETNWSINGPKKRITISVCEVYNDYNPMKWRGTISLNYFQRRYVMVTGVCLKRKDRNSGFNVRVTWWKRCKTWYKRFTLFDFESAVWLLHTPARVFRPLNKCTLTSPIAELQQSGRCSDITTRGSLLWHESGHTVVFRRESQPLRNPVWLCCPVSAYITGDLCIGLEHRSCDCHDVWSRWWFLVCSC